MSRSRKNMPGRSRTPRKLVGVVYSAKARRHVRISVPRKARDRQVWAIELQKKQQTRVY